MVGGNNRGIETVEGCNFMVMGNSPDFHCTCDFHSPVAYITCWDVDWPDRAISYSLCLWIFHLGAILRRGKFALRSA